MFSNKNTQNNRSNRIDSTSKRSTTPQHYQTQKLERTSQSVSKPPINPILPSINNLAPISQQLQAEKPYYIGKGNNGQLIKRILIRRKGWKQVSSTDFTYFRWVQNGFTFKFHLLGKQCYCFNHFQYQRQLSNKQRLVKNMVNFCEANKMNAYNFIPVSFILDLNTGEQDLALHAFIKFFNRNYPEDGGNRRYQSIILPRNKYVPYLTAQQLNKRSQGNFYCKPTCPKTFFDQETKSYLWILKPTFLNRGRGVVLFKQLDELEKLIWKYYEGEGLEDYCEKYGHGSEQKNNNQSVINFDDQLNNGQDLVKQKPSQIVQSKQASKNKSEEKKHNILTQPSQQHKDQSLKNIPSFGKKQSNQTQKTIAPKTVQQQISSSVNILGASTNNNIKQGAPRCLSFIIQKYIQKPMLIEGKKFDIRVWVLLTHTLQFYIFSQAYLRFSSQPYSTKDSHLNPFIHLTNNSVQKYCNEYDKTSGNQWSLSDIQKYIFPENKASHIYKTILNKIKEIICLSMYSVRRKINVNSRKECFELFGYDFMIDAQYKVWLIQINTNPAIEEASPLLKILLPRMVDDMFKLTIDKIFNCKIKQNLQQFPVKGYANDQNMWEFLGDLKESGGNQKNGRRFTFARR